MTTWVGNFVGCIIFVCLLQAAGTFDGKDWYLIYSTEKKSHWPWGMALVKGIFANWIVAIATWLANAAQVRTRVRLWLLMLCGCLWLPLPCSWRRTDAVAAGRLHPRERSVID